MQNQKTNRFFFYLSMLIIFSVSFSVSSAIASSSPPPEKEWTFLLFLNGHNNLSDFGEMNIKDMEKSGSTDNVNLVVEWGKADDNDTHRFLVEKSTDPAKVTSPMLISRPNVDMGDYHNLIDFVKWGIETYPAKHYFVAVWNHGSGWHINDISFDDNTGNSISTEQLGLAMTEIKTLIGRSIDIYGSDACLMQMIEVVGEMKDSVNYFVGSQDLEPGEGWPYAPFIQKWTTNPMMSPAEVSVLLSKEYLSAYKSDGVYGEKDVTFSAFDVSKIDSLNQSIAKLTAQLLTLDPDSMKSLKSAAESTQEFYYADYKDLGHFLKRIESMSIQSDKAAIEQVRSDLANVVLSTDNSEKFKFATGLSIWLPTYQASMHMDRYKGLQFDKITNWSSLITSMSSIR